MNQLGGRKMKQSLVVVLAIFSLLSGGMVSAQDGVVIKGPKGSAAENVREGTERYGPIDSDDTLWNIASQSRPDSSVSTNQMMAAIVQANPRAFVNGNMNRMLDGFYLRIPSLQEIQMVNPVTANRQLELDLSLLEKDRDIAASQQNVETTRREQQQILEEARAKAETTVREVRAEQETEFQTLREQMASSMATVENVYNENDELRSRIDELAEQLAALQAALSEEGELPSQLQQIIEQQQQLLAQQREREAAEAGTSVSEWLSDPVNIALLALLPAALVLAFLYFVFVRRNRNETPAVAEAPKRNQREMTDEEAAAQLDAELLDGPLSEDDRDLLDLDDDLAELDDLDDGDDLSSLEDELLVPDEDKDANDEFSIHLDDDDDDELFKGSDNDPVVASETNENDNEKDNDDSSDAVNLDDFDADDSNGNISQDELDQLLADTEGDVAIDLSIDESELDDADEASPEQTAAVADETPPEPDQDAVNEEVEEDTELLPDPDAVVYSEEDKEDEQRSEAATASSAPDSGDDLDLDDIFDELGVADENESQAEDVDLEELLAESDELTKAVDEPAGETDEPDTTDEQAAETQTDDTDGDTESELTSEQTADDDMFVDIDTLIDEAQQEDEQDDPYNSDSVNSLLDDTEIEGTGEAEEDDSPAAQLDLARAYIEMDDIDEARVILDKVITSAEDDAVINEAKELQARLDN